MDTPSPSDSEEDFSDALEDVDITDPEDEDLSDEPAPEEDPKVLAKRAKDNQRAARKLMRENAELRGAIQEMRNSRQPEKQEDWLDQIDPEELEHDPAKVVQILKEIRTDILGQAAGVLKQHFSEVDSKIASQNPELIKHRELIEELREDDEFTEWTDEMLLPVAKRLASKGRKVAPKGAPGGRRPGAEPQKRDVASSDLYKLMYGDLTPAEGDK